MPSLGGLASTLYQMGQQAREDQLRQIQQNKEMQDRHLKFVEGLANDPTIDPAMRPEIIQHWLETSSQTPEKFKPEKTTKWFGDISQRHHQAQVLQNQQADAESAANPQERQGAPQQMPDLQGLLSSAVPDASGQLPAGASPIPPMSGGEPLPAYQFPERSQRETTNFTPFFDPNRPVQADIAKKHAEFSAAINAADEMVKKFGVDENGKPILSRAQALDLWMNKALPKDTSAQKVWQEIPEGAIDPKDPSKGRQAAYVNLTNPAERMYIGPYSPKPGTGKPEILFDKAGDPLFYRDESGKLLSPDSPDIPADIKAGMAAAKTKPPTLPEGERPLRNVDAYNNAFTRRWQAANHKGQPLPPEYTLAPDATQKDFDRISGLLEKEEQAISTKQRNDETAADRSERLAALEAQRALVRDDRSYTETNRGIDALEKPVADLGGRMSRLVDTNGQGNIVADALVAPELLSIIAGGAGSGLRMNEAEIARVVGGRTHWADLKAAASKWTDQTTARSITPEQADQIKALVKVVNDKIQAKLVTIQSERAELSQATNPQEHRKIAARLRKSLEDIDAGKKVLAPLGTATPPPNPPVSGLPNVGDTFQGGRVLKIEKIK
jgi:hypothetical protein